MPITEHFDENALLLECRIRLTVLRSEQDLADALDEYAKAIDLISNNIHDDNIYYFGITVSLKPDLVKVLNLGTSVGLVKGIAKDRKSWDGRNSWKSVCPEFWIVAYQFPLLRPRIISILDRIEKLLIQVQSVGRSTASLWEDEQTQFGEPLVSLFAFHDVGFVNNYRFLMNLWDMDHEFQQYEVINAIIHVHGMSEETEQLLYDRCLVSGGQNGENQIEELYPLLQQTYGAFTQSRLFERIIADAHSLDMQDRQDALEEYQQMKLADPGASPRARNEPPFHFSDNLELKLGAQRIFERLDSTHYLSDFLSRSDT